MSYFGFPPARRLRVAGPSPELPLQNAKLPNGQPFFNKNDESDELRIGVTMSLDWWAPINIGLFSYFVWISLRRFKPTSSTFVSSHLSGNSFFCVSNLPPSLRWVILIYLKYVQTLIYFLLKTRYRVKNLLITYMTPGPNEPNGEQLQSYQQIVVDDMLQLWDGMKIPTPKRPEGLISFQ